MSRIRVRSTSEARNTIKHLGWRQKRKKGGWRAGEKSVGRRERRAGGTLISSEDCRILQMRIEDFQPGSNTPRAPKGAADLWAAAAAADPSQDGMSGERESRGRLCEHIARF